MHNTHAIETKNLVLNNYSLVVAQKQLGRLLVIHKIDSFATTQAQNIKNQNTCITKKITKLKLWSDVSNHQMWFEVTQDEIISHNK
jgi:hypothetical protein